MPDSDVLAPFVETIELAYGRLGHQLGWRFLYSPARTLAADTRLAFVALNPGDKVYHPPLPSVEEGNAYRVERWWGARQKGGLQDQIRRLYDGLAQSLGDTTVEQLMDQTLALNFCPFRSPAWKGLVSPAESIEFSRKMWSRVLDIVEPRAIICLGTEPMRYLESLLADRGAARQYRRSRPVGWGTVAYATARYATPRGTEVTMVQLPHLSRFRIFGRPESQRATTDIVATVSAALRSSST